MYVVCIMLFRKYYDAIPELQSGSKFVDLKSGDYCSALFSEDQCWYRAKIVDVFNQPRSKQFSIYVFILYTCAVLLCLVCLFDLACFFLSSFSSLI